MRGKTNSPYSLGARKRKAFDYFGRGYKPAEVAREIQVSLGTAVRYKAAYEAQVQSEAQANPAMLRNVVANTMRALAELDQVREEMWKRYERASSDATRVQIMNVIIKAQDQRAKLFGLFGVRQDFFMHVAQVREQQNKLLEFMQEHLCPADRVKLEEYIMTEFNDELNRMPTADVEH